MMAMSIIRVNIGAARMLQTAKRNEWTGIFKTGVDGPVKVSRLGVEGDTVVDLKHHGGPDQSVYIYGQVDTDWWSRELRNNELAPGVFGENLTIAGLSSMDFSVGDRLKIGNILLEVTAPRIPCATLAARMGDPEFVKRFRQAERPGLYCRVLQEGTVWAGLDVTRIPCPTETVSILDLFRDHYQPDLSEKAIRRFLAAPLSVRLREKKETQLAQVINNME